MRTHFTIVFRFELGLGLEHLDMESDQYQR